MKQVNLLREKLRPHLGWHGARLSFLAIFIIALIRVKTVNLSELATAFSGSALTDSHYKRLQRFFKNFEIDYETIAHTVVNLINIPQPWVLSIDRTEWKFGDKTFNILTLGIVYEGIAFPVVWSFLDKRGNSNTHERMELFQEFLKYFPDKYFKFLSAEHEFRKEKWGGLIQDAVLPNNQLMGFKTSPFFKEQSDREFVGQDWFCYLLADPKTPFRIRIKENYKLYDGKRNLSVKTVFQDLQPGESKVLRNKRRLWGLWLYVVAQRLDDGSLLVVVTQTEQHRAIADYAYRWGIETLFGIFKTRGFCLESTHIKDSKRLSKLFAILTLALCWAVLIGEWLHQKKPLTIKKHGRKAKSIFRYGFDHLRSILLNLDVKMTAFTHTLQFLSCT
mgnify:CR=1 FL=1